MDYTIYHDAKEDNPQSRSLVWPLIIWVLAIVYAGLVQFYSPFISDAIDWHSVFSEGLLALFTAIGLLVVSKYQGNFASYIVLFMALTLLLLAFTTDTLDEFVEMPEFLNFIVEGIFQDLGVILLIYGLYQWVSEHKNDSKKIAQKNSELVEAMQRLEQQIKVNEELKKREKENIYRATVQGTQHILGNLLNQIGLVKLEIDKCPTFNESTRDKFNLMTQEAKELVQKLASVKEIEEQKIKDSFYPKQK